MKNSILFVGLLFCATLSSAQPPILLTDFGNPGFCFGSPKAQFGCFLEMTSDSLINSRPASMRIEFNLNIGEYGGWGIAMNGQGTRGARYLSFFVLRSSNNCHFEIKAKDLDKKEGVVYSWNYLDHNAQGWQEVRVPLQDFAKQGVNLFRLESFSLGTNYSLTGPGTNYIWVDDFYLVF